jgi:hypothetical protein
MAGQGLVGARLEFNLIQHYLSISAKSHNRVRQQVRRDTSEFASRLRVPFCALVDANREA